MKIAVVGMGVMGQHHARVLRDLGHTVVGVDPKGHTDCVDLGLADCHACAIATPPDQTHKVAMQAEKLGYQVLLIEKPAALDLRCASLMAAAYPDTAVGYVERFNPALRELRRNLYRVGLVTDIRIERTGPAGRHHLDPALDLATHDLDALAFLGLPRRVRAYLNTGTTLNCLLDNGTLTAGHGHPSKRRTIHILGTDGELACDYQAQSLTYIHAGGTDNLSPAYAEPLRLMWQAILSGQPTATLSDAINTLRLALPLCRKQPPASNVPHSSRSARDHAALPAPTDTRHGTTTTPPTTDPGSGRSYAA